MRPWKKSYDKPWQRFKKQRHHFASYGFSMYRCESWTIKKAEHQRTDAFELWCWRRLLTVPWTARRSNQSILEGNKHWIFIGRTDVEAEAPILWPPDGKGWLTGKDPDAGKDWGQEENRMTEDEVVGWHHQLNRHEFEQTARDSKKQGSLAWGSSWGRKELDTTEQQQSLIKPSKNVLDTGLNVPQIVIHLILPKTLWSIIIPFLQWRNWSTKRLNNLSKIINY